VTGRHSESVGRTLVGWLVRSASPQALLAFRANIFGQKGREAVGHGHRTKEVPRRPVSPRPARDVRVPESMEFLIFEDNGVACHWRIVAGDGATLAQSGSFASYQDA